MKRLALVTDEPELRFQYSYNGTVTVLEGEELQRLLSRFFWHNSRLAKECGDGAKAFVWAVIKAYQGLYAENIVFESELQDLATADSRKMDLLYRGLFLLLLETEDPGKDWERRLVRRRSFLDIFNDVLMLRPNLFGIGVDINAIISRASKKRRTTAEPRQSSGRKPQTARFRRSLA